MNYQQHHGSRIGRYAITQLPREQAGIVIDFSRLLKAYGPGMRSREVYECLDFRDLIFRIGVRNLLTGISLHDPETPGSVESLVWEYLEDVGFSEELERMIRSDEALRLFDRLIGDLRIDYENHLENRLNCPPDVPVFGNYHIAKWINETTALLVMS